MSKNDITLFGILNVTPDSFSDGGKFLNEQKAISHAEKMIKNRADYIDIGGESTRPNAQAITWKEEWNRIRKVVTVLIQKYPGQISLDTKNWQTAQQFFELGGTVLNNVSGFQDPKMIALAVEYQPMVIINHFPGKTVPEVHSQQIDSLEAVRDDLLSKKQTLIDVGIEASKIILDPGIGFGKTMDLNWKLLEFAKFVPKEKVLIGHSRKRFLGIDRFKPETNNKAAQVALLAGAWGLRVHEIT